jgi:hypothetical protein
MVKSIRDARLLTVETDIVNHCQSSSLLEEPAQTHQRINVPTRFVNHCRSRFKYSHETATFKLFLESPSNIHKLVARGKTFKRKQVSINSSTVQRYHDQFNDGESSTDLSDGRSLLFSVPDGKYRVAGDSAE